ncbi:DUF4011 domain-containing protein [Succinivibrio dextrinosolvens]|uniref:DUF4011 domain-containing protein n=1 Tax=Succinivibrio dextrinosolvens TaxID=83771 RepID=UPI0019228897|nr:DUF4011 domain-containing protein [Succinivibrio dextrinosolvens]
MKEPNEVETNQWLDNRRKKLLDPSRRNKLIHCAIKGARKNTFVATNGSIQDFFELLGRDAKLILTGIPNTKDKKSIATAEEYGLPTSIELPLNKIKIGESDESLIKNLNTCITKLSEEEKDAYLNHFENFSQDNNIDSDDVIKLMKKVSPTCDSLDAFFKGIISKRIFLDDYINKKRFHLQTLFYDSELQSLANKIYRDENSLEQEKGTSFLYLVLGFLKWKEKDSSRDEIFSPLFIVPVKITKELVNGRYVFYLTKNFSEIQVNLSLKLRLKNDFSVEIPDISPEDSPKTYFSRVEEYLSDFIKNEGWEICNNVALAILDFTKLVMYRDLDPKLWDKENKLSDHPVVKQLIYGAETKSNAHNIQLKEMSDLEKINLIKQLKLVESADSSQIEALLNIINSQDSFVIQGPPGTGKSQTITNLIALELYQGKKVLFVSEKMAALEVVKAKLDNVGLGSFCLELHKDNNKKDVIKDLYSSSENFYSGNSKYNESLILSSYERIEKNLDYYVNLLHSTYKKTGKTIYQILNHAVFLNLNLKNSIRERVRLKDFTPDDYTPEKEKVMSFAIDNFITQINAVKEQIGPNLSLKEHPWRGAWIKTNTPSSRQQILDNLNFWQKDLVSIKKIIDILISKGVIFPKVTESFLREICKKIGSFDLKYRTFNLDLLKHFVSDSLYEEKINVVLTASETVRKAMEELFSSRVITASLLANLQQQNYVCIKDTFVEDYKFKPTTQIAEVEHIYSEIEQTNQLMYSCISKLQKTAQSYLKESLSAIPYTLKGISVCVEFFDFIFTLDPNNIPYREILSKTPLDKIIKLRNDLKELSRLEDYIEDVVHVDKLVKSCSIEKDISIYKNSNFIVKLFSRKVKEAKEKLKEYSVTSKIKPILETQNSISEYLKKKRQINDVAVIKEYSGLFNNNFTIKQIISLLDNWNDWYCQVNKQFGSTFSNKNPLKKLLLTISNEDFYSFKNDQIVDNIDIKSFFKEKVKSLTDIKKSYPEFFNHLPHFDTEIGISNSEFSCALSVLEELIKKLKTMFDVDYVQLGRCSDFIKKFNAIQCSSEILKNEEAWIKKELISGDSSFNLYKEKIPNLETILDTLKLNEFLTSLNLEGYAYLINSIDNQDKLKEFFSYLTTINDCYEKAEEHKDYFLKSINSNSIEWEIHPDLSLDSMISRNQEAIDKGDSLSGLSALNISKNNLDKLGCEEYTKRIFQNENEISSLKQYIFADVYNSLSDSIYENHKELEEMSGARINALQKEFKRLDRTLISAKREIVRNAVLKLQKKLNTEPRYIGEKGAKVNDLTEFQLIKHENTKQRQHIALRQLFKRAPNASLLLKPCFMMSPLTVANYIEPSGIKFDVLIMDEASQVKPEEAIGAIARADQFIVVGDPQQMPPSNFFEREISSYDNEDEIDVIDEDKSILEAAISANFPMKTLNWHYRSLHESLIAFSNYNFYENRLIVFPSPKANTAEFGIKFEYIQDGYFSNQINMTEAKKVVDATIEHALTSPDESLAIVAMNVKQMELINDLFNNLALNDSKARQAKKILENRAKEKLIIKNLETIQGDERDVVFISCTYGKDPETNRVYQRFGPINNPGGEKRLNVLLSRARKRMQIFSSMLPEDISNSESRGTNLLKAFLNYSKNGILSPKGTVQGKTPDSDFEIAVIRLLQQSGFECVAQVGVQGYYIDIAVLDPNHPGEYLMGIECDGAMYHSSAIAKERDCLRQAILERLGWKIRRIWSTDWFQDPEGAISPILNELNFLKSNPDQVFHQPSEEEDSSTKEYELSDFGILQESELTRISEGEDSKETIQEQQAASEKEENTEREKNLGRTVPIENKSTENSDTDSEIRVIWKFADGRTATEYEQHKKESDSSNSSEYISNTESEINYEDLKLPIERRQEILKRIFSEAGIQYIDHLMKNGSFWIIGGQELTEIVNKLKKYDIHFKYKPEGGRATKGKPAWWYYP